MHCTTQVSWNILEKQCTTTVGLSKPCVKVATPNYSPGKTQEGAGLHIPAGRRHSLGHQI